MSPAVLAAVEEVVAEVAALDAALDRLLAADARVPADVTIGGAA